MDNRPLEMSTLDGDIKLEYRDDFGRVQTPKEAFRSISWKFHGKAHGSKEAVDVVDTHRCRAGRTWSDGSCAWRTR